MTTGAAAWSLSRFDCAQRAKNSGARICSSVGLE